jgi:hypothetical protein
MKKVIIMLCFATLASGQPVNEINEIILEKGMKENDAMASYQSLILVPPVSNEEPIPVKKEKKLVRVSNIRGIEHHDLKGTPTRMSEKPWVFPEENYREKRSQYEYNDFELNQRIIRK